MLGGSGSFLAQCNDLVLMISHLIMRVTCAIHPINLCDHIHLNTPLHVPTISFQL